MRCALAILVCCLAAARAQSPRGEADPPKPSQEELLAAELQKPFLRAAAWHTEWAAALAAAKAKSRLIFGYFTTVEH